MGNPHGLEDYYLTTIWCAQKSGAVLILSYRCEISIWLDIVAQDVILTKKTNKNKQILEVELEGSLFCFLSKKKNDISLPFLKLS